VERVAAALKTPPEIRGHGSCPSTAGSAATLFTIAVSCAAEAVAAHPARKLVLFDGKIVARDGTFLAAPIRIASEAIP
jgi:hypothetical protein